MGKRLSKGVFLGVVLIFILFVISSIFFTFILKFTNTTEAGLKMILMVTGGFSLFIGALFAGLKSKIKGWLVGLLTSGIFTSIVFLVQYLGYDNSFSTTQTIQHAIYLLVSIIGGIFGVNLSGGKIEE
ncbi:MAG: TIGR04086 family membrane protein [Bacillaceae bacterium]